MRDLCRKSELLERRDPQKGSELGYISDPALWSELNPTRDLYQKSELFHKSDPAGKSEQVNNAI